MEPINLRQVVENLSEHGHAMRPAHVRCLHYIGRINLEPYLVGKEPGMNGGKLYDPALVDELLRYCQSRWKRPKSRLPERRRASKKARYEDLAKVRQPQHVVEARLRDLQERYPDKEERADMWARAIWRLRGCNRKDGAA